MHTDDRRETNFAITGSDARQPDLLPLDRLGVRPIIFPREGERRWVNSPPLSATM